MPGARRLPESVCCGSCEAMEGGIRGLRWMGTKSGFRGKNAKDLAKICG